MLVGIPKEIKNHEYRVGLVPSSVRELINHGHKVIVEQSAGAGVNISDQDYQDAGAEIVDTPQEIFERAEMVVKVKEPLEPEYSLLRENQILFTFLHLSADKPQAEALMASGTTAIAYETVTDSFGHLPLLKPMSEVAGRLSVQAGAHCLEKAQGGLGILLGGVPGVQPAKVTIIGGGTVGTQALRMAIGLGARVSVVDKSLERLRQLDNDFSTRINTVYATAEAIAEHCATADMVIGAVLVPGAAAPKLISRQILKSIQEGSVLVDVAIDQGGCAETSRPTTYENPTYMEEGVVHYCVANMPGAVPRTSTFALNNATISYVVELANNGLAALKNNPHLLNGLNVYQGKVTYQAVANDLNLDYMDSQEIVKRVA